MHLSGNRHVLPRLLRCAGLCGLAAAVGCSSGGRPQPVAVVSGDFMVFGGFRSGPAPLRGSIRFDSDAHTYTVKADQAGHFQARLPAGRYTVTGTSPQIQSGDGPCSWPLVVTVAAGQRLQQQVACHIP